VVAGQTKERQMDVSQYLQAMEQLERATESIWNNAPEPFKTQAFKCGWALDDTKKRLRSWGYDLLRDRDRMLLATAGMNAQRLEACGDFERAVKEIQAAIFLLRNSPGGPFDDIFGGPLTPEQEADLRLRDLGPPASAPTMDTGLPGESNQIPPKNPPIPKNEDD
jgi:hypothetical protein